MVGTYAKVNLCHPEGKMSVCTKPTDHSAQENCLYYDLASCGTRCMYLQFDEYCTNYHAQKGKTPPKKDDMPSEWN